MNAKRDSKLARPSLGAARQDGEWRAVIRWIAVAIALLGLALVAHEIWENATCSAVACAKLHLSTMIWGLTLLSFGLLIIQKGDVSTSLKDLTQSGTIVRSWWRTGRADDPPNTIVKTSVTVPTVEPSTPVGELIAGEGD